MTASNQYRKENQDVIQFKVPKGRRDELKDYASSRGLTLTGLVLDSVRLYQDIFSLPDDQIDRIFEIIYPDNYK